MSGVMKKSVIIKRSGKPSSFAMSCDQIFFPFMPIGKNNRQTGRIGYNTNFKIDMNKLDTNCVTIVTLIMLCTLCAETEGLPLGTKLPKSIQFCA